MLTDSISLPLMQNGAGGLFFFLKSTTVSLVLATFGEVIGDWVKQQQNGLICPVVCSVLSKQFHARTRDLYHEAGFGVSELTSGITLGFQYYKAGLLFTEINHRGN